MLTRIGLEAAAAIPDWSDNPVCVCASGPSAPDILRRVCGYMRVIVVNRTFEIAPWADALYAADSGFWMVYSGARKFEGLKFAPDISCKRHCPSVDLLHPLRVNGAIINRMVFAPIGTIGGGGHSGFQAINLAIHTGAREIYLAGFDYLDHHWHEDHPTSLRNPDAPTVTKWCSVLDAQSDDIKSHGIIIKNMSLRSRLKNYDFESCEFVCSKLAPLSVRGVLERSVASRVSSDFRSGNAPLS